MSRTRITSPSSSSPTSAIWNTSVKSEDTVGGILRIAESLLMARILATEGRELAKHFGCRFIETSAKQRLNVDEAFSNLVREIRKYNKVRTLFSTPRPSIRDSHFHLSRRNKQLDDREHQERARADNTTRRIRVRAVVPAARSSNLSFIEHTFFTRCAFPSCVFNDYPLVLSLYTLPSSTLDIL